MSSARENILQRLRAKPRSTSDAPANLAPAYGWNKQEKIERLTYQMQAVRSEVHRLGENLWIDWLNSELPKRKLNRVLTGNTNQGRAFKESAENAINVQYYAQNIQPFKTQLFNQIDAAITTTRGGIADTGSLILWPDETEPRLLSLVPPVHIALLKANEIYDSLSQAIELQHWKNGMPGNALLVSGPSKTADIQQTLAYGIHGPKELIVLILE
ncbi:MAG: lactate utilization protein [Gammaproteobacteria bacterium]|nr:lactate utilization protein [Gammaproteobacteria bacterium]